MATPRKRRKLVVFSIICVCLAALTLTAIFRKKEAAITVQTEKVARRDITEIVVANGRIQPVKQVVISPEVAGEIIELPVKEGVCVKKGDLLVQIKPDNYIASHNSAEAVYKSAMAGTLLAMAQLEKAEAEFHRNRRLFTNELVSDSTFLDAKTTYDVALLQYTNAVHSEAQARYGVDKARDDLSKTKILSPMEGTVTRLNSQAGERVLGTSFNKGTEIMVISDLNEMEARVDIGETDVVLIEPGQTVRLEVDAFKDRKFTGTVTEIANSAKGSGTSQATQVASTQQEATKFEVRIRVKEKEAAFRPGMSVTAEIETRSRTNVLTVPIASVTTRAPKEKSDAKKVAAKSPPDTNTTAAATAGTGRKEASKQVEVVFLVNGDKAKMVPVKIGISDDTYWEITEGIEEGQEVISGGYRAVGHDLEDGRKIAKGAAKDSDKKEL